MREINIKIDKKISSIVIGGSIRDIENFTDPSTTVIISDSNVNSFYHEYFKNYRTIIIDTGEGIKTLPTVKFIIEELLKADADRNTFILGVGGGIVCDIAGFIASIFMRGIKFGFISTTLLSQVDASVGGKNGVNLNGLKNMIGVFNQPKFVICDHEMLNTLPDREYVNGIAELLKTAFLEKGSLLDYIKSNKKNLRNKELSTVEECVYKSVKFKSEIVTDDERESGRRRILNFGHTIGHGIEKTKQIPHGFAVAAGMSAAIDISTDMAILDKNHAESMKDLIRYFGLPSSIKEIISLSEIDSLLNAISKDKKKTGEKIKFILLKSAGNPEIIDFKLNQLKEKIIKLTSLEA